MTQPYHWIYGTHACLAALENPKRKWRKVLVTPNFLAKNPKLSHLCHFTTAAANDINKQLPPGAVHQGIAVLVHPLPHISLEDVLDQRLVVLLDQVTDPQNVGAIMRSATAFRAAAIIVPKRHSPGEMGTLTKAASGTFEHTPLITVSNFAQAMRTLKENQFWCVGLSGYSKQSIRDFNAPDKTALVLGAEGKGLRRLTSQSCDVLLKLPIDPKVESLNVSAAAAIALYALEIKDTRT